MRLLLIALYPLRMAAHYACAKAGPGPTLDEIRDALATLRDTHDRDRAAA